MTSNEIRFDRLRRDDLGAFEIVPRIDGTPLTELIDAFEIDAGMQPAGDAYGGLVPRFFRSGPIADHFRGQPTGAAGSRKTPVLGCACGDWGCWPLKARITLTPNRVIWDSFEQPHRTARDYSKFGPFRFDQHQYEAALRALSAEFGSDIEGPA